MELWYVWTVSCLPIPLSDLAKRRENNKREETHRRQNARTEVDEQKPQVVVVVYARRWIDTLLQQRSAGQRLEARGLAGQGREVLSFPWIR